MHDGELGGFREAVRASSGVVDLWRFGSHCGAVELCGSGPLGLAARTLMQEAVDLKAPKHAMRS